MKKENSIVCKQKIYDMKILSNDLVLAGSLTGQTFLLNVKTREKIGGDDNYGITCYSDFNFCCLKKKVQVPQENGCIQNVVYVSIYDMVCKKFVAQNYQYISRIDLCFVLKNPETQKFHLFDEETFRDEENIFEQEFDSIEALISNHYGGTYFAVEQNGKKGIYHQGGEIIDPIEYDDIKKAKGYSVVILEKDQQAYFSSYSPFDGFSKSSAFNSIESDPENNNILYAKTDDAIMAYNISVDSYGETSCRLLRKFPLTDEIRCLRNSRRESEPNIYSVKQGDMYGLYGFHANKGDYNQFNVPTATKVVDPIYDRIDRKGENYFLYKDDKVGLYRYYYRLYQDSSYLIDAKYDAIQEIVGAYLLFTDGMCDIVTLTHLETPYVRNCEFVDSHSEDIIFRENNQCGIYMPSQEEPVIIKGMDDIVYQLTCRGKYLYTTKKEDKYGLIYDRAELISPKYKSITSHSYDIDTCYIALQDDTIKLAKLSKGDQKPQFSILDNEYQRIEFYKEFMLLDDGTQTILCDYHGTTLKIFLTGIMVSQIGTVKEMSLYNVDGTCYFYKYGVFEPAFIENYDLYTTSYVSDENHFQVSTFLKPEHDAFCSFIDSRDDEEAERILLEMSNDTKSLQKKYPTLKLERFPKTDH